MPARFSEAKIKKLTPGDAVPVAVPSAMPVPRITIGGLRKLTTPSIGSSQGVAGQFLPAGSVPVPFASLTCYDATMARWLCRAGVQVLLVGDTAAEMVLGFARTSDMPLDVLLALTAGVRRGITAATTDSKAPDGTVIPLLMGDMPFLTYHLSEDDAVRNAARFLTEGQADVVKLEVDATFAPRVARMNQAGIPICAHIGSRPQRAAMTGGYASAGRTKAEAASIMTDAKAMLDAGCPMMLIEAVPDEVGSAVTDLCTAAKVPLIGIGAGTSCHGQVLVLTDLLGLTDKSPLFVKRAADLGTAVTAAAKGWVDTVAKRGAGASPYTMR